VGGVLFCGVWWLFCDGRVGVCGGGCEGEMVFHVDLP